MEIISTFSRSGEDTLGNFAAWLQGKRDFEKVPQSVASLRATISDLKLEEADQVRNVYRNPTVDQSETEFTWGRPRFSLIEKFLTKHMGGKSEIFAKELHLLQRDLENSGPSRNRSILPQSTDGEKKTSDR